MPPPVFSYLVVTPTGASHEHHRRVTGQATIWDIIRTAVGGGTDRIRITDPGLTLWCDEQGFIKALPANPVGSRLVQLLGGVAAAYLGPIVATGYGRNGATSLTPDQIDHLLALLRRCRSCKPDSNAGPNGDRYAAEPHC